MGNSGLNCALPPLPPQVLDILKDCGFTEDRFFIHCDGALFGMMMPFLKKAPMVSFKKPISAVSVSGHKFVGAPVPCGIVITRFKYVMALSSDVEYLNSRDATIMGSRNGHAPIYLWYTLTRKVRRQGGAPQALMHLLFGSDRCPCKMKMKIKIPAPDQGLYKLVMPAL